MGDDDDDYRENDFSEDKNGDDNDYDDEYDDDKHFNYLL